MKKLVGIKEIKIIHSKDLVLYILENGEIITYTLDEDSKILNHENQISSKGTDEKRYYPVYDFNESMIGFTIV